MCLQSKSSSSQTSGLEEESPCHVRQPRFTPLTAWLMTAKQGQALCSGCSTASVHGSRSQALLAQKCWLLAPHQLTASSRECPRASQLCLAKANAEAEAQACSLDCNQVKGCSYFTSSEAAATLRFHLEENQGCSVCANLCVSHPNSTRIVVLVLNTELTFNGFLGEPRSETHIYFTK